MAAILDFKKGIAQYLWRHKLGYRKNQLIEELVLVLNKLLINGEHYVKIQNLSKHGVKTELLWQQIVPLMQNISIILSNKF